MARKNTTKSAYMTLRMSLETRKLLEEHQESLEDRSLNWVVLNALEEYLHKWQAIRTGQGANTKPSKK